MKNFDNFSSHYFEPTKKKFRNLADANGAEWRDLRKGLSPTFSSGKIKGMLNLIHGCVDNMVSYLEDATKENPSVMVKKTFQSMALDVIAKVKPQSSVYVYTFIKKLSSVHLASNPIHMKTLTMKCSSTARRCSRSFKSPPRREVWR